MSPVRRSAALLPPALASLLLGGCAFVPLQDAERTRAAKEFPDPPPGKSNLYLYRDDVVGAAVKRKLYVDGQYIGETGFNTFFFRTLDPGRHAVQTQSEFEVRKLDLLAEPGQVHYIRQGIVPGIFTAGTVLVPQDPIAAKPAIRKLQLAADMDDPSQDLPDALYGEGLGSSPASVAAPEKPRTTLETTQTTRPPPRETPRPPDTPRTNSEKPRTVPEKPRTTPEKPRTAPNPPRTNSEKPQAATEKPEAATEKPQAVLSPVVPSGPVPRVNAGELGGARTPDPAARVEDSDVEAERARKSARDEARQKMAGQAPATPSANGKTGEKTAP